MERWEDFYFEGAKQGCLYRRWADHVLTTRIAFGSGPDGYRAESVIRFEPGTGRWDTSSYRQGPGLTEASARREDFGLPGTSLPSYGEYLLVADMIGSGTQAVEFFRLDDAAPAEPDSGAWARVSLAGTEDVLLTDGRRSLCDRFEVVQSARMRETVAGLPGRKDYALDAGAELVGVHWSAAGRVVKSDWRGAKSFLAPDRATATASLDRTLIDFLDAGYGARPAPAD